MDKINKKFLICSHRGYRTGNIIENTFLAFKSAIILGADIVEIDISKSSDNELYVFHDGSEKRLLLEEKSILDMKSSEIENLEYINSIGEKSGYKVEKLFDFLNKVEKFKKDNKKFYINIDRSWNYLKETLEIINKYDLLDNIIIKTPIKEKYLKILNDNEKKYMYLGLIIEVGDFEKLNNKIFKNLNIIGYEYSGKYKGEINNNNSFQIKWINALKLSQVERLFDEYNDDNSILNNGKGWIKLLSMGFNVIQTDHVAILNKYRGELK